MQLGHARVKKSYTRGDLTVILSYAVLILLCPRICLPAEVTVIESLRIIYFFVNRSQIITY